MPRSFSFPDFNIRGGTSSQLLRITAIALGILNVAALYFYIAPPGGSRSDLRQQEDSIRQAILTRRAAANRLKTVAAKVEQGDAQTAQFAGRYFLPYRNAYGLVLAELLRLSSAAGLRQGQATYSREPIEGTDDLTLLTINMNYQGRYPELMRFVNEVDHSDQLLILDSLQASPQQQGQGGGNLNVTARFLTVVRDEEGSPGTSAQADRGGQP